MSDAGKINLTIDGVQVSASPGATIWEAARSAGIEIPVLCHQSNLDPVGVCRVCAVEVQGARVYAAACVRAVENGMVVSTGNARLEQSRKTLIELLLSDHPAPCARHQKFGDCELEVLAEKTGVTQPAFNSRTASKGADVSNLSISVDHSACIVCDRCVRACTDLKHNNVIGRMGKGYLTSISFDDDRPMGESSCVNCGECMVSCPTGALTSGEMVGTRMDSGDVLSPEDLLRYPIFAGISSAFLARNTGGIVRRHYRKGEIICREGEYGSTAFYILQGQVDVFLGTSVAHVAKRRDSGMGWFKKMTSVLVSRTEDPRSGEKRQSYIPIDAPVDLSYDRPVAQLGEGDLFGEMTCLNFYPRSATVRAAEDCIVLEMLRNVLQILQKNRDFQAHMEEVYRKRALDNHLRSVPIFQNLPSDFLEYLRDRVQLKRFEAGEVICRQGEPADAFYLVRIGHVKVSQARPGGEMVLAYLAKGLYFGEIGLLARGERTATCTALDHVEVVKISQREFDQMLSQFPDIQTELQRVAGQRLESNEKQSEMLKTVPLDDFLSQGLMQAQNLLVLDLESCVRCDDCVRACGAAHDGFTRLVREGLRFDKYLVATSCRQCRDPLCMVGCPVGSIRRQDSLEIIIEDWCIGCGLCAQQCPYGNINLHEFPVRERNPETGAFETVLKKKATVCDLCTDHKEPSCVYACPHNAAHRVDPRTFFDLQLQPTGLASKEPSSS
ncbi:MAG: cyclic nucleotide-binding domain-containing protein [Acidobacteriota bacterium]